MKNEASKIIASASEMSNLVGMFAFKIDKDYKLTGQFYIAGKASNEYFIVQSISPLDGCPSVAKLVTLEQLKKCIIIPNKKLANRLLEDYFKDQVWKYIPIEL